MPDDYQPTPHDLKIQELARPYSYELDLAFFVVEIGMSVKEFNQLTETEKMFLRKEHENKFIKDVTWNRNAVINAEANVNRSKNKRFIDLFPKKNKADIEYNENAIQNITEMEDEKGKDWVNRIYQANGI